MREHERETGARVRERERDMRETWERDIDMRERHERDMRERHERET